MNIYIVNGPNLNLLGKREPEVYGSQTFEAYFLTLQNRFEGQCTLHYFQSNHEGALIDYLQQVGFGEAQGIVLNAGAYTHTSIAISDAIRAITTPVVEVHISNIYARESFRHHSYLTGVCKGIISGLGLQGYALAITYLVEESSNW